MTGIISGVDYSLLFSGGGASASANILSALYGGATSSGTTVSTGDPITDEKLAETNQTRDVAQEAKDPTVVRDVAAFAKAVAGSKDVASALKNPNVLKVLLTANGLSDQVQYPALASKVLLSDPKDPKSLVNVLADTRWLNVVKAYNLKVNGLAALQSGTAQATLANQYARVSWLNSLDKSTPGLAEALQFKQQASSIKNVDQILGDPTNWEVVLTALGIPQQIAFQDLPAQEKAVSSQLDIKKLQDPKFVNALTDRYLLAKQQAASSSSTTPSMDSLAIQAAGIVV